jgi:hypothetical protein
MHRLCACQKSILFTPLYMQSTRYFQNCKLSEIQDTLRPIRINLTQFEQKQIVQVISALQNVGPECPALNNLAWFAYVDAIAAFATTTGQWPLYLAAFSIVHFLDHCLMREHDELGISETKTLDTIARMLRIQCSTQIDDCHSEKHIHTCALLAACCLKRCDVFAATFFAKEASRLIRTSWLSLRLTRSLIIEPTQIADFIVVCQCALLNTDFFTAHGMCAKIIDAGNSNSYYCHSILHHGHVLKAMTNLLQGTVQSSLFHLECANAFGISDSLDTPTFVPEIR